MPSNCGRARARRWRDRPERRPQLVAKEGEYALLKLPSGETRKVLAECMATIGQVGNTDHENVSIAKRGATAGRAFARLIVVSS